MAEILKLIATLITLVAMALFICGLVCAKVVGVEMMAVIQIAFYGLVTIKGLNPTFSALVGLWPSSGYNRLLGRDVFVEHTSMQIKAIDHSFSFIYNYNCILALFLLLVLFGSVVWAIALFKKEKEEKVNFSLIATTFVYEFAFTVLMFSSYVIIVSAAVEFVFWNKESDDFVVKVSLAATALMIFATVLYALLLTFRNTLFGEFHAKFVRSSLWSRFYLFMILERWISGVSLILAIETRFPLLPSMLCCLTLLVVCAVFRPYKKKWHNVRFVANMFVSLCILGIYFYYAFSPAEVKGSKVCTFLPFVVLILLLITVLINGVFIVQSMVTAIRNKKYKKFCHSKSETEDIEVLRKISIDCGPSTRKLTMTTMMESPRKGDNELNDFEALRLKTMRRELRQTLTSKCKNIISPK